MKLLLKNGKVVNVFTKEIIEANVLIENEKIIGVGAYSDVEADTVMDLKGKWICPSFIDGHIHIESTMLTPYELSRICIVHGTGAIVCDPHEIANVCGTDGIRYILEASEGLPMEVYVNLPSCVPATMFDESGAELFAEDLKPLYQEKRVLGLAEMMNYPGVIFKDEHVIAKLKDAVDLEKHIDGHAPLLSGKQLDSYLSYGIQTDHECSNFTEAKERIEKGQWVMIREGTSAKNLEGLIQLLDYPYSARCVFSTDDKHPADLIQNGHIDSIIRKAIQLGKDPITAISVATIQSAECFRLKYLGAIAPGYIANLTILEDLENVVVSDVIYRGSIVYENYQLKEYPQPIISETLLNKVKSSFQVKNLSSEDFYIQPQKGKARVISLIQGQILTKEWQTEVDNYDIDKDILKLAVVERHHKTNHIGLGYIHGVGMKTGAIASSVSHDSHNIIVIGTNDADMAFAVNEIVKMGGGNIVVKDGNIIEKMNLPIAGLMSEETAENASLQNEKVRSAVAQLGNINGIEPFMNMAFVSLTVIPELKLTTLGLVDVNQFKIVPLYVE